MRRLVVAACLLVLTGCGSGGRLETRTVDGRECVVMTDRFNKPVDVECEWDEAK